MARITTIDCERVIPNRFELVLLAEKSSGIIRLHDGETIPAVTKAIRSLG